MVRSHTEWRKEAWKREGMEGDFFLSTQISRRAFVVFAAEAMAVARLGALGRDVRHSEEGDEKQELHVCVGLGGFFRGVCRGLVVGPDKPTAPFWTQRSNRVNRARCVCKI